uniref:Mediator of RNA polymerase II transcription subunit 6 n=1 Tax=Blastobotrys adeninivorans TaxID=409370 RepID=A0A060SZY4_BLAAD
MEPLDEVLWRAPEWIQAFGLRSDNVLEYFSQSPFYDRTSNNQVLKMQSQFNENLNTRDLSAELKNMQGIEFVVAIEREPDMWVIRKQNRLSPHEARLEATYFVVGDNIFMAPAIYSIVSSRLLSTSQSLSKALETAVSLPTYSPSQGYSYVNDVSALETDDNSVSVKRPASSSSNSQASALRSNYNSPMPSSATSNPAGQTPSNINNNITIPAVHDKVSTFYMDKALNSTLSNSTVFIDSADHVTDLKAIQPDKPRRKKR